MNTEDRAAAEGILFTDMYQLTMAQLYFRAGIHEQTVLFEHVFRSYPDYGEHQAGYCISAGMEWLLDWMAGARFERDEIDYLRSQRTVSGAQLFDEDFLGYLASDPVFDSLTIEAVPEGRAVHPNVPLTVVQGALLGAQLLETSLLNHLNYQTLIATKASRVSESARGRTVLEFGLRRAPDRGASAGARAAMIGGADYTSNVGMSRFLGLAPKGTHAHSMVQVYMALGMEEIGAFEAYADAFPDECLLLVDTIDTLGSGVPNAIRVFEKLRGRGYQPIGIRLDSGDLAYLSIQARKMLDEAGFEGTTIVLSNQLEELSIWQILAQIEQEAPRYGVDAGHLIDNLSFGVGSRLITSYGSAYLDGVYKVVAVHEAGEWRPAIKVSDNIEKITTPGRKSVWRVYDDRERATADLLTLREEDPGESDPLILHHHTEHQTVRRLAAASVSSFEQLLETVFEGGERQVDTPTIEQMRSRRNDDLSRLDPGVRRLVNPHVYHVSLSERLWALKQGLIVAARGP